MVDPNGSADAAAPRCAHDSTLLGRHGTVSRAERIRTARFYRTDQRRAVVTHLRAHLWIPSAFTLAQTFGSTSVSSLTPEAFAVIKPANEA